VTRHVNMFKKLKDRSQSAPKPKVQTEDLVTCSFCATTRPRGTVHRCNVGPLIELSSSTKSVLKAIRQAGGTPIIVGGSVRDAILNAEKGAGTYQAKDIDIEVFGIEDPALLKDYLARRAPVDERGVSFGVLTMQMGGTDYDISLPRRDSKSGRGHKGFDIEVDPTLGEVEAFGRRDFTINAMGFDPTKEELVDPYGGTQDLYDRVLRHTTPAFSDDPLRVLRGVQFAARFGFDMAPETVEESARIKDSFGEIATERVWGEFEKILTKGTHVSKAIHVLQDTGWMDHFPELGRMADVPQDPKWHPEGDVLTHLGLAADRAIEKSISADAVKARPLVVFTALVHDFGKYGDGTQIHKNPDGTLDKITSYGHDDMADEAIDSFAARIGAPRSLSDPAKKIVREHMSHVTAGDGEPSSSAVRKLVRRLGDGSDGATLANWARVVDADHGGRAEASVDGSGWKWVEKARQLDSIVPRKPLLRGGMLDELGVPKTPVMGEIIKASIVAQDNEEFTDHDGAREWARNYIAGMSFPTARIAPIPRRK
jgi:tRNA nucleotidyltransferase (CCA-adding enzyme)